MDDPRLTPARPEVAAKYLEGKVKAARFVAGMGIALLPKSVLTTFPEGKRLTVHTLPAGENRAETVLIWRKGADSPNIQALRQVLSEHRPKSRSQTKRRG